MGGSLAGDAIKIVVWAALLLGGFFYLVGAIGLNRMPDLFTRMHAVSVSDTLGVGLLTLGMMIHAGSSLIAVKLLIVLLVLWTTGAVASHALARAALHDGAKPVLARSDGRLVETDCVELFPELSVRLAQPLTSEALESETGRTQPIPRPLDVSTARQALANTSAEADPPAHAVAAVDMAMAFTRMHIHGTRAALRLFSARPRRNRDDDKSGGRGD